MMGVPHWTPGERADRFAKFVPAVAALLRTGELSDTVLGDGDSRGGVRLSNHGGVRLTVAALGPRSIELAARYADVWNSYGVQTGARVTGRLSHPEALELFRARRRRFDRACASLGRDTAAPSRSYAWVDSYLEPVLADVSASLAVARDFRDAGVDEFIVYWPTDAALEARLAEFVGELSLL